MPTTKIIDIEAVGTRTVAIELETPSDFDAEPGQFVLVRVDDESGYYTISSKNVRDTFEITVEYDEEGTVGPWLANLNPGEEIEIEGPHGDIRYTGGDVTTVVGGPGIGPGIGIVERAVAEGDEAMLVYFTDDPAYEDRLSELPEQSVHLHYVNDQNQLEACIEDLNRGVPSYVFGFQSFVTTVRDALEGSGFDDEHIHVENFGPE